MATNGSTTVFPFTFTVLAKSDLKVFLVTSANVELEFVENTNYFVTLNADQNTNPGGFITTAITHVTGSFIFITTDAAYTQTLDVSNVTAVYPNAFEAAFDRIVILIQQLNDRLNRAAVLPISTPSVDNYAGSVFGINPDGTATIKLLSDIDPTVTLLSPFIQTLIDDTTQGQARQTLGMADFVGSQFATAVTTAGTSPNFTCSTPSGGYPTSLLPNQLLRVKFHANGVTGSNTLNRAGLGQKTLAQYDSTGNKVSSIIKANQLAYVEYDGAEYVILNPLPPTVPSNALNVPIRQTVLSGPIDSSGFPSFLPATSVSLNLTSQNITPSSPLICTAGLGFDILGAVNGVGLSDGNLTWSGLTANSANFLYVDISGGTLVPGSTVFKPIYQHGGNYSIVNGQATFNIQQMEMRVGDGVNAVLTERVFIGECVTDATSVILTKTYAYQGRYDSGYTNTLIGAAGTTQREHRIGIEPYLEYQEVIECITADLNYSVGDIVMNPMGSNGTFAVPPAFSLNRIDISMRRPSSSAYSLTNKTTGTYAGLTAARWKYKFEVTRGW